MDQLLKVLVTGTSKGIGFDLAKIFLTNNPNAVIYATSRQNPQDATNRWKQIDIHSKVRCKRLDITSEANINQFVEQISLEQIKFDIVVNNAGICSTSDEETVQYAKRCLFTNTIGPILLTERLLPHLSQNCKIINVSSSFGALNKQPIQTQSRFTNPNISKEDILSAVEEFIKQVQNKTFDHFNRNIYATSKMILGAWSRFVLQKRWLKGNQIAVTVSPGLCSTPMTAGFGQEIMKNANSCQSGALKIYQTIFMENLDPQIFYHRARQSDFYTCGQGLPRNN